MAAPVRSREFTASKDNHSAATSSADTNEILRNLKLEIDLTLFHFNESIRYQYCRQVFFLTDSCPESNFDNSAFNFKAFPKKLDQLGRDHFDSEEKVNEALRSTLHNFQAYPIHLQKIKENPTPDEGDLSHQYDVLKEHVKKLHEELQNLMKLRGLKPLPSVTFSDSEIENLHKLDPSTAKQVHYGILVEIINCVEYFSLIMPYLSPAHQSTKL